MIAKRRLKIETVSFLAQPVEWLESGLNRGCSFWSQMTIAQKGAPSAGRLPAWLSSPFRLCRSAELTKKRWKMWPEATHQLIIFRNIFWTIFTASRVHETFILNSSATPSLTAWNREMREETTILLETMDEDGQECSQKSKHTKNSSGQLICKHC